MRDYGKVHTAFWSNAGIRALPEDARVLALYLLTCPHGTIAGVFRLPDGYVCEDLQWAQPRVQAALLALEQAGFARRCAHTGWVWIMRHLVWNPPENPNQRKAVSKVLALVPSGCAWWPEFVAEMAAVSPMLPGVPPLPGTVGGTLPVAERRGAAGLESGLAGMPAMPGIAGLGRQQLAEGLEGEGERAAEAARRRLAGGPVGAVAGEGVAGGVVAGSGAGMEDAAATPCPSVVLAAAPYPAPVPVLCSARCSTQCAAQGSTPCPTPECAAGGMGEGVSGQTRGEGAVAGLQSPGQPLPNQQQKQEQQQEQQRKQEHEQKQGPEQRQGRVYPHGPGRGGEVSEIADVSEGAQASARLTGSGEAVGQGGPDVLVRGGGREGLPLPEPAALAVRGLPGEEGAGVIGSAGAIGSAGGGLLLVSPRAGRVEAARLAGGAGSAERIQTAAAIETIETIETIEVAEVTETMAAEEAEGAAEVEEAIKAIAARAVALTALLRQRGAAVQASDPRVRGWAKQGVSDAQILRALEIAQTRRQEKADARPVNSGLLDVILGDVLAESAAAGSGHGGGTKGRRRFEGGPGASLQARNRASLAAARVAILAREAGYANG